MPFELNDEKATDVLIWWIEGTDGSIDYTEEQAVERVLEDMNYSLETYYQKTLMHIGALSTEHMKELVDKAIEWGKEHFDEHRKKLTLALLENIASCDGDITPEEQEKLDRIEKGFGISSE